MDQRIEKLEQKLLEIQKHYLDLVKHTFEACETSALQYESTKNGIKYIESSKYKMHIRNLKAQVLKELRNLHV